MTQVERVAQTPDYPPGWLVGQLPVGMRDDDLLVRFTTIFERLAGTLRAGADGVEHVADPTVTSPRMLAVLHGWLGYDLIDDHVPVEERRRLVAALGRALPWRGTRHGLATVLEALTGGPVVIDDPGAVIGPGAGDRDDHTSDGVVAVRTASTGHLPPDQFLALVRDEVPAHLGVRVIVAGTEIGADAP